MESNEEKGKTGSAGWNLMLMSEQGILQTLYVPGTPAGRYCFEPDAPVYLEAVAGQWMIRCRRSAEFLIDTEIGGAKALPVSDQAMLPIRAEGIDYMLCVEKSQDEIGVYHNYQLVFQTELRIGRLEDNDIIYSGKTVSRHHAILRQQEGFWQIEDTGSANGVYVNGFRVDCTMLETGDVVGIMGLRILIGSGFLSINDGNPYVHINDRILKRIHRSSGNARSHGSEEEAAEDGLFHRLPRRRLAGEASAITIEPPPMSLAGEKVPLLLRMGSSMVMGGTAALTGNVSMLATSMLLPVISQRYTKEEREEYEISRKETYGRYLAEKREEILLEKEREEMVLRSNYPPLAEVLAYPEQKKKLWERRKTDDDFLVLRLGSGRIPFRAKMNYPQRRFEMERDELQEKMYALAERQILLEDVPILLNLQEDRVCGVQGGRPEILRFLQAMLIRLAVLYSYDEVKLVLLAEPEEMRQLEAIRYLPHVWDDGHRMRFVTSEISKAYQISDAISKSLGEDLEKPDRLSDMMKRHPYYIVFAMSRRLVEGMGVLKAAMQQEGNCGISLFAAFPDLPKECSVLLTLSGDKRYADTLLQLKHPEQEEQCFWQDFWQEADAKAAMRTVANTRMKLASETFALPKTLTFLEMCGVGRLEYLNIEKRWRENNPVTTLAVPVGVGTDGELFYLDLHQKAQGPHGLVAGTTGSGKSEFLITYILSLALNFHPDEVAFVLIDYKGGGLAGAFDDPVNGIELPHLAGTITNLDGAAIARSLVSIQSEMKRRQRVFNEAKSIAGEGTMDIYMYQRLYRNQVVAEPMPHLFIISDEFAELKQQEPEFLDQLVSIARIGRSLGVHLILATQKPSGVVTDQIVSNTKFRVCLKVQDRSDSMEMLKRPEAAELRETGRFYLQVGNNELFALGQSAWSGAEYEPQDEVVVKKDGSVQVLDDTGDTILEVKPEVKKHGTGRSQLTELTRELTRIAREHGISQHLLWLPALEKQIDRSRMEEEGAKTAPDALLYTCCGLLDDPAAQKQYPMYLDYGKCGNILVAGEPGCGKTTFIQTMLLSLAERYSPKQVQFYILDYSSRMLRIFDGLPHCGGVLGEEQESALPAFFRLLGELLQERKRLFTELEADGYEAACRIRQIPLILVVIDNLPGLHASKTGQAYYERLNQYMKEGRNYGIKYVVSITHLNEVSLRFRQELTERIAIHMKDKYDYGELVGCRVSYIPPDLPGRGLYAYKGIPLEMQLSMEAPKLQGAERTRHLKDKIQALCARYEGIIGAKRIPVISESETYEAFCRKFQGLRIPLGYEKKTGQAIALPLKQFGLLSLYFGNPQGVAPVFDHFLYAAKRENMAVLFARRREGSCFEELTYAKDVLSYATDAKDTVEMKDILLGKIQQRHARFLKYCEEQGLDPEKKDIHLELFSWMHEQAKPILFVIERYADLCKTTQEVDGLLRVFSSIYLLAKRYQIYIVAGFYPHEESLLLGNKLYDCFQKEKLAMLFGGAYAGQKLLTLPFQIKESDQPGAYNECLMSYRGELHELLMPCGELKRETEDMDTASIFAQ